MKTRKLIRRGFTLIELLCVLVILAVLAGITLPKIVGRTEQAKETAAKTDISNTKTALDAFETDCSRYPTSDEGLQALVNKPGDLQGWTHAYLDKVPVDPWGHNYIYRCPGTNGTDFDLVSMGPDGVEGTADDLTNH
jgi:general secretion pathway protein G